MDESFASAMGEFLKLSPQEFIKRLIECRPIGPNVIRLITDQFKLPFSSIDQKKIKLALSNMQFAYKQSLSGTSANDGKSQYEFKKAEQYVMEYMKKNGIKIL